MSNNTNSDAIKKVTVLGIVMNIIFCVIKAIVGWIGNSQAVIADAIHSLSDLVTDFAVLIGVRYWDREPDATHTYGHRKIESFVTFGIGLVLGIIGIRLFMNAVQNLSVPAEYQTRMIAAVGPFLSIIGKEALYRITIKTGKKTKSSALIANAWHHRSDAISSIPALLAVVLCSIFPNIYYVDSIGAMIVSVFILKVSFDIIKPAFGEMIDRSADRFLMDSIREGVLSLEEVQSTHKLRSRGTSGAIFIDLHIQVDENLSIKDGHMISGKVKNKILSLDNRIIDVLIHLEPAITASLRE
ncbi:MAG: cation transporter [Spirochaetales bacterium]|nr:cation transporter [Spirochaetales bacterium]